MKKAGKLGVLTQLGLTTRAGRTVLSARLAQLGLYSGQDAVLLALAESGGLTLRDLAARLQVKPPTITKTIARLSAHALVEKRISVSDARQSYAHLTPKGLELVDAIRDAQKGVAAVALTGIGGKDRRRLRKLLQHMERNLALADALVAGAGAEPEAPEAEAPASMLHVTGSSA